LDQERDELMTDSTAQARPANSRYAARTGRRPGRKPKSSVPVVVAETPDKPDPNHVLTWRQRKVLQVIGDSVRNRGYPPSMQEIAGAVGLTSTSSVLYRDAGRPRTMEVRLPGRPPVRREDAHERGEATPSNRELIASLASRRAELGLSQEEVARRMQTSQATVAYLEAQLAMLTRYAEALGA
jgi:DNA-binding XRE family transcriptional regulator